jgi:4-amino-4-deoxy-L-arabinose transferase-like glycosyltransferase
MVDLPRRAAVIPLAAALVAAVFCFLRLGATPFDDPGEGMHAEIARELLRSGDLLRLTLNGVVYVDKPPLLYWLQAGAFTVFGTSEGTARSVSAAAAVASVAATAWLGAKLLGPVGGCLAGAALLTSALFFAYARYVRPDALFVAALAWGFALTLIGIADARRWLIGWGLVAFGIAGLAKDPMGALAPPVVILAALALRGQARPLSRWLPWPGLAACILLGVGWWIFSEVSTAGTLWYTVVDNKILNVLGARVFPDEDVPLSAVEFLTVALLGALPWSLGAVVTIVRLVRARAWREPAETPWIALSLWTLCILAITVLSRFRLPHYGLPVYPALALLAARAWLTPNARWLAVSHAGLLGVLSVAGAALARSDGRGFMTAVIGATDVATRKTRIAGEADPFPGWDTLQPLVAHASLVFGMATLVLLIVLALRARIGTSALAPSVVAIAMLAVMPDVATALGTMSTYRSARAVAMVLTSRLGPGDVLAHEGPIEQSGALEWYSGRRPVIVDGRRSVLAFGATQLESAPFFWTAADLERAWRQQRVWIVTARSPAHSLAARLPGARLIGTFGARWLYGPPEPR